MMDYWKLNNGVEMPVLGFGAFLLGGEACENAVSNENAEIAIEQSIKNLQTDYIGLLRIIMLRGRLWNLFTKMDT